jgi:hypothetical protein
MKHFHEQLRKRPRRPLPGMLLHQDGSRHAWIEGLPAMDLIVTMPVHTPGLCTHLHLFTLCRIPAECSSPPKNRWKLRF